MDIVLHLLSILFDSAILNIVTYLGIALTIYFSVRVHHKKIKFVVGRKDDEYVVVFWNSCNQPIFKEDLFAFCLFANADCICKTIYSNDSMIPLELSIKENDLLYDEQLGLRFDSLVKRIDLSFDFLNKRKGYILHIKNAQKGSRCPAKLAIYGRIRGESNSSIQCLKRTDRYDTIRLTDIKKLILLTANILLCATFLLYIVAGLIQVSDGITLNDSIRIYNGLFVTVVFVTTFCMQVYLWRMNKIPYDLNHVYKQYFSLNYKEVSSKTIKF